MNATDHLLTPKEVADLLRVSPATLEAWRQTQTGPKWVKLGEGKRAPVRYRKSDIDAYLSEHVSG